MKIYVDIIYNYYVYVTSENLELFSY